MNCFNAQRRRWHFLLANNQPTQCFVFSDFSDIQVGTMIIKRWFYACCGIPLIKQIEILRHALMGENLRRKNVYIESQYQAWEIINGKKITAKNHAYEIVAYVVARLWNVKCSHAFFMIQTVPISFGIHVKIFTIYQNFLLNFLMIQH